MNKLLLLAAAVSALSLGGVAVAQDAQPQPAPTDQAMPPDHMMPAEQATPADPAAPASQPMPAPSNEMPTPQPSTENYPVCSRTVTDKCINPSQAPHHHKARPHKKAHR